MDYIAETSYLSANYSFSDDEAKYDKVDNYDMINSEKNQNRIYSDGESSTSSNTMSNSSLGHKVRPFYKSRPTVQRYVYNTYSSSSSSTTTSTVSKYSVPKANIESYHEILSSKPCCVDCREAQLAQIEKWEATHIYENCDINKRDDNTDICGRLLIYELLELHSYHDGLQRINALQKKIEKLLHFSPSIKLTEEKRIDNFTEKCHIYSKLIERRLRAIRDVSPSAFQSVSTQICVIISSARKTSRFDRLRRSIRKVLPRKLSQ